MSVRIVAGQEGAWLELDDGAKRPLPAEESLALALLTRAGRSELIGFTTEAEANDRPVVWTELALRYAGEDLDDFSFLIVPAQALEVGKVISAVNGQLALWSRPWTRDDAPPSQAEVAAAHGLVEAIEALA